MSQIHLDGSQTPSVEVLKETRKLIFSKRNWSRGGFYKRPLVPGWGPSYCILGALSQVRTGVPYSPWACPEVRYLSSLCGKGLASFNDVYGHAAVIALLDVAIENLETREKEFFDISDDIQNLEDRGPKDVGVQPVSTDVEPELQLIG